MSTPSARRRLSRREALSKVGALTAGLGAAVIVSGVTGFLIGGQQQRAMTITETLTTTVRQTVTETVTATPAAPGRRRPIPTGPPVETVGLGFPLHITGSLWGILRDEGILEEWQRAFNVKVVDFIETTDDVPVFSAKKADWTNSASSYEAMLIHSIRKNDPKFRTVVFGKWIGVFLGIYTQVDSPIERLADLRGKKFGIGGFGGCDWTGWYPYAKAVEGIDLAEEAEVITSGYLATPELIAKGELDAGISAPLFGINRYILEGKVRPLYRGDSLQGVWFRRTGHLGPSCGAFVIYKDVYDKNPHIAEMVLGMYNEAMNRFLSDVPGYIRKYSRVWPKSVIENPRELELLIEWLRDPIGGSLYKDMTLDSKWIDGELEFMDLIVEAGLIEKGTVYPEFEIIKPGRKP